MDGHAGGVVRPSEAAQGLPGKKQQQENPKNAGSRRCRKIQGSALYNSAFFRGSLMTRA